ncbi:hypothetical protein BDV93DRAFT_523162 [Ceratobasidium sp. AG-I]|nr:hypothetical protein BDV93DRAFT_523162 [Ceratobasidium sp. AG-I]
MRFALTSFVTLGAAALAVAQPYRSINPPLGVIHPVEDAPAVPSEPLTNAKRFALNMPPARPKAHRRRPHGVAPRGGSRVGSAPRAASSPLPPVAAKCNILVKVSGGAQLGFVNRRLNSFGQLGTLQPSQNSDALQVAFSYPPDSPSQLDLTATNSYSSAYTFVGAAVGYSSDSNDFAPGSPNYGYVTGTKQAAPGRAVMGDTMYSLSTGIPADYESAIWVYNPTTRAITAQWINADHSATTTQILYTNDGNGDFLLTGDKAALNEAFGTDYPEVTFTCVPPVAAP